MRSQCELSSFPDLLWTNRSGNEIRAKLILRLRKFFWLPVALTLLVIYAVNVCPGTQYLLPNMQILRDLLQKANVHE